MEQDQFTILENQTIGRNISMFRKIRGVKAFDIADQLGMKEATYTKYERGETNITIEFVQKVAEILRVDPIQILTTSPAHFLENIQHSSIAIQHHSTFQTVNEQQTQMMLKLMENVLSVTEKLIKLVDSKKSTEE